MTSTIRPFTEDEREKQIEQIGAFYGYFTDLVAQNRKMKSDSVENLAQGKVWTGKEAVENGLIDEVGGLKQALDYTAARLNLEDYRIVFYPEKRPLFVLPRNPAFNALASILGIKGNNESENVQVSSVFNEGSLFTRMLFDISIE